MPPKVQAAPPDTRAPLQPRRSSRRPQQLASGRTEAEDLPHAFQSQVSINTDDFGVFSTTASAELALVAETFGLPPRRVAGLAAAALDHAFDADATFAARFRADVEAALAECAARYPQA